MCVATLAWAAQAWPAAAQESIERLRRQANENTVGIISGGVAGTYVRIASDLASVLDDPAKLRVLAIIGKGSLQNINDVLYLRGIDIGIVQSDVFAYARRQNLHPGIDKLTDALGGGHRRAEGADNLRSSHHSTLADL